MSTALHAPDLSGHFTRLHINRFKERDYDRHLQPLKDLSGKAWAAYSALDPKSPAARRAMAAHLRFEEEVTKATLALAYDMSRTTDEENNLILNSGCDQLMKAARGDASLVLWTAANARIAVGDNNPAAGHSYTQTTLQATTNILLKGMDSGWPKVPTDLAGGAQGSNARIWEFKSTFASGDANFSWQEFGTSQAASGGIYLNRFVSNQGTKVSGQIWEVTEQFKIN